MVNAPGRTRVLIVRVPVAGDVDAPITASPGDDAMATGRDAALAVAVGSVWGNGEAFAVL
jgi:hypothetical protein